MADTLELIKKLRGATNISMMACKKALDENHNDYDKAYEYLRKRGVMKAAEKSERSTMYGIIVSYVHGNKKIGAMIQLACETDFVAKNDDFIQLANNLAIQIVASNPMGINFEDIDENFIQKEREIWEAQLKNEGKPNDKIEMILNNKEKKFKEENCLMKQVFVKDPEQNVEQLIHDAINKLGENIKVIKFVRYSI